jgi:hypothetical protein
MGAYAHSTGMCDMAMLHHFTIRALICSLTGHFSTLVLHVLAFLSNIEQTHCASPTSIEFPYQ